MDDKLALFFANAVFRVVKIMVNEVTFVGFRGAIAHWIHPG